MTALYSQGVEESIIYEAVKGLGSGYVLDIGAGDGFTFSNSARLIERGWRGLLVEPSFFAFAKLYGLYREAGAVKLLNAAVGLDGHMIPFYECEDTLYSTTRLANMEAWASRGKKYGCYWVPTITIEEIVNQFEGAPDVVSIDTEGNSFEILRSFPAPWLKHARVLCVEHDQRCVEIAKWAYEWNYRPHLLDDNNLVLVKA